MSKHHKKEETMPAQHKVAKYIMPHVWFLVGFLVAAMFLFTGVAAYFRITYKDRVIPGVYIDDMYVGEKKEQELRAIFDEKNKKIGKHTFTLTHDEKIATVSAKDLQIGYDTDLIVTQAMSLGKTPHILGNFSVLLNSYTNGAYLRSSYLYQPEKLPIYLKNIADELYVEPTNASFAVENNRVVTFSESKPGRAVDYEKIQEKIKTEVPGLIKTLDKQELAFSIPIKELEPETTTEEANNLGIVEPIGSGKSYYAGSIVNRAYNVGLAASRVNGVLVAPGEEFSFNKSIGDVSKYTGYKEAYVIQAGRTVLGDGGGVCQVSTTLFRAVLNAGLPITERHAHAYRVGYYEQQSPPGLDATIYVPSVDFKFKNDTQDHILIQSFIDPNETSLTFTLYGKKDNRVVKVTDPVITRSAPPPEPVYQDDPTLPKDTIKQVEHAANGATVVFSRTVEKDGKVVIDEKYTSNYRPWKAVFLKGTKEG